VAKASTYDKLIVLCYHIMDKFSCIMCNYVKCYPCLTCKLIGFQVHAVKLKCLLIFSVERNWCTVVRKLLDVACGHRNIESGVSRLSQVLKDDVSLLHRAVRNKDRCMVELLLAYVPPFASSENHANSGGLDQFSKVMQFKLQWGNLFRPDMSGPAGLTPLHVAASLQDAEGVVDALTSDPFQVCTVLKTNSVCLVKYHIL
jgi:hypothetical protein